MTPRSAKDIRHLRRGPCPAARHCNAPSIQGLGYLGKARALGLQRQDEQQDVGRKLLGAVPAARSGTAAALINVARMAGATIGVAVLGAVFAIGGGGPSGLRLAMLLGGALQVAAAASAWTTTRAPKTSGAGGR